MLLIYQFFYFLGALVSLPFLPLMFWQAKYIRARIPDLPEATGPREGRLGEGGRDFRLLALGESTMAGVGVSHHEAGLVGAMVRALQQRLGRPVQWKIVARSGLTVAQAREVLLSQVPYEPQDLIVIGLGGNDTFQRNSPLKWRRDLIRFIGALREKQPHCPIVISKLPPVGQFPAFTPLLQFFLGGLVHLHYRAIRDLPQTLPGVYFPEKPSDLRRYLGAETGAESLEDFFSDGVHPNGLAYTLIGEDIVDFFFSKAIASK